MCVVYGSAVIAILMGEVEAGRIASALASDARRLMSTFSALEAAIVVESRKGNDFARTDVVPARW